MWRMRRLGLLLCLVLSARAGDEPLVRIHDVADLKADDTWYALAMIKAKAAAKGGEVRPQGRCILVVGPAAVQEKVAKELTAIRESLGKAVDMELRFVKVEGGLGVPSVSAEKVDELLRERKAETLAGPRLTCFNGQRASVSVARKVSYVSDFTFATDKQGNVTADPVVDTLPDGITVNLRPFIAGQAVRIAADVTVAEVGDQMREIELPLPLPQPVKIQVPEATSRSVRTLLDCAPGEYAVLDLGGGRVVLIRATAMALKDLPGDEFPGEEVQLK
jgi:Bacterial type II and III secretion system protein